MYLHVCVCCAFHLFNTAERAALNCFGASRGTGQEGKLEYGKNPPILVKCQPVFLLCSRRLIAKVNVLRTSKMWPKPDCNPGGFLSWTPFRRRLMFCKVYICSKVLVSLLSVKINWLFCRVVALSKGFPSLWWGWGEVGQGQQVQKNTVSAAWLGLGHARVICFVLAGWSETLVETNDSVCNCGLLQAANSYLRDQWFHSLQWKVSSVPHYLPYLPLRILSSIPYSCMDKVFFLQKP